MRHDSLEWHEAVAGLIGNLDSPALPALLISTLGKIAPFDGMIITAYRNREKPIHLFDNYDSEGRKKRREICVNAYLEGAYLLDPFYHACTHGVASGLYRLQDLAPDNFRNSEYYRSYYVRTGASEETGFFVQFPKNITVVVSMARRRDRPVFTKRTLGRFRAIEPVVSAIVRQHWRDLVDTLERGETWQAGPVSIGNQLEMAYRSFGRSVLTDRECEIARLVVHGHSSKSIARCLKVSPGTVKIHRKHIYKKLHISSQAELFSLFLSTLSRATEMGAGRSRRAR